MRYTEIRMQRLTHEMLEDLDKETVDFIRTTTSRSANPPCSRQGPELLVNGSAGIAVGMATNIPPHNLSRSSTPCGAHQQPQMTSDELMAHIPGPDFPTRASSMAKRAFAKRIEPAGIIRSGARDGGEGQAQSDEP